MVAQAMLILALSLMKVGIASGCSMAGGHDYVIDLSDTSECKIFLDPQTISQGANLRDFINKNDLIPKMSGGRSNHCEKFDPTAKDEQALYAAILRYNNDSTLPRTGKISIRRLSHDAHIKLLDEAEVINSNECGCNRIAFVERIGDLTASFAHRGACRIGAMCQLIPPEGCFSRFKYDSHEFILRHFKTFVIASLVIGLSILTTLIALIGVLIRRIFYMVRRP